MLDDIVVVGRIAFAHFGEESGRVLRVVFQFGDDSIDGFQEFFAFIAPLADLGEKLSKFSIA